MLKARLIAALTFAALLGILINTVAGAATIASWKAPIGSSSYNGYATLVANAAGTGTVKVVAKRLTRSATYPVEVRSRSCTGTRLFALTSVRSSSTGTIVKSYALTASQAIKVLATSKLYIRVGSSTRARCGQFVPTVPTGAISGTTVRVPAGRYSGGLHLLTVEAVETWLPGASTSPRPGPGNVFLTVLVRVDAQSSMSYNASDYRIRDTNGLQYRQTIERVPATGREPGLYSGELTSGKYVEGWLTFEVPASRESSLTLVYNPTDGVTVLVKLTPLPFASTPSGTPTPTPPAAWFGSGTYIVGSTLQPGTYRSGGGPYCYWERLSGFSRTIDDVIANNYGGGSQIVTIAASDAGFASQDCATWVLQSPPIPAQPTAPGTFGDGTWRVTIDIPAGTYQSVAGTTSCYWERVSGFGGTIDEIIANDFGTVGAVVTISLTDAGFKTRGCGTWTLVQ